MSVLIMIFISIDLGACCGGCQLGHRVAPMADTSPAGTETPGDQTPPVLSDVQPEGSVISFAEDSILSEINERRPLPFRRENTAIKRAEYSGDAVVLQSLGAVGNASFLDDKPEIPVSPSPSSPV